MSKVSTLDPATYVIHFLNTNKLIQAEHLYSVKSYATTELVGSGKIAIHLFPIPRKLNQ
jgi:hypothetical protein